MGNTKPISEPAQGNDKGPSRTHYPLPVCLLSQIWSC